MRYLSILVLSLFLAIVSVNVSGQEISQSPDANPLESRNVAGVLHNVMAEHGRIIVDDRTYVVGETVWVDGTRYRLDEASELLDQGETVKLELSGQRINGYSEVSRIRTGS